MTKKYAVLTLILSLITTQTFTIIPENISKTFSFFQDTKKSIFQRFMEYLQEKTGLSYAQEKEKRNQEDYFVKFNLQLIKKAEARNNSFLQKSTEDKKKLCKNILKADGSFQKDLNLIWESLENTEEDLRNFYKKAEKVRDLRQELLNSDNPDLAIYTAPAKYDNWQDYSHAFWDHVITLKYCKECYKKDVYKNVWGE